MLSLMRELRNVLRNARLRTGPTASKTQGFPTSWYPPQAFGRLPLPSIYTSGKHQAHRRHRSSRGRSRSSTSRSGGGGGPISPPSSTPSEVYRSQPAAPGSLPRAPPVAPQSQTRPMIARPTYSRVREEQKTVVKEGVPVTALRLRLLEFLLFPRCS